MLAIRCSVLTVAGLALLAGAGCTGEPQPPGTAQSSSPAPGASATAVTAPTVRATPPPVLPGELTRRVFSGGEDRTDFRAVARADTEYGVRVVCISATPGRTLGYELRRATGKDGFVASSTVPCNSAEGRFRMDAMNLPAEPVGIEFDGGAQGLDDITFAYAVIAPAEVLLRQD